MRLPQGQLAVLCNRAISKTIALPLDPDSTAPLSPALNIAARPEKLETQSVQGSSSIMLCPPPLSVLMLVFLWKGRIRLDPQPLLIRCCFSW